MVRAVMSRRSKPVSAEEEAHFRAVLADTKPLKKRHKPVVQPQQRVRVFVPRPRFPSEPVYNEQPAGAIGGHADAHLRRGRLEPEARLDLHGLTHDGAYRALLRFLFGAQAAGQKLVLVITGKGGVLRERLPLWLGQAELQPLVAGVNKAHVKHGGGGAFYVLLRRHKLSR
jgi:DNA-nicking Smr family endonuclease